MSKIRIEAAEKAEPLTVEYGDITTITIQHIEDFSAEGVMKFNILDDRHKKVVSLEAKNKNTEAIEKRKVEISLAAIDLISIYGFANELERAKWVSLSLKDRIVILDHYRDFIEGKLGK